MKKLFVLSALLFTAAFAAPVKDNTLTGKITDWPAGKTGEMQLRLLDYLTDTPDTVVMTTPIDAGGNFKLALPDAAALAKVLPPKDASYSYAGLCQGSLTLDKAAQVNFFDLRAFVDGKEVSNVKYRTSRTPWPWLADNFRFQELVFSTADTKIDGAASCNLANSHYYDQTSQRMRVETTADLKAGWNTLSGTDSGSKTVFTGDPMPKEAFWHVQIGYGGVGMRVASTDDNKNVQVTVVQPGGAAEAAGMKVGDIVLAVDDHQIKANEWQNASEHVRGEEGTTVILTVKRGAETLKIPIKRQYVQVK